MVRTPNAATKTPDPTRRRSTRGLPTPASTKRGTSSTSPTSAELDDFRADDEETDGLRTPVSMVGDTPARKRKVGDDSDASPSTVSLSDRPKKKLAVPVVTIPARRSKLGTEKTSSADNLTLDPASGRVIANKAVGDKGEQEDEEPVGRTSRAKAKEEAQPFNVGKYSSVSKKALSSLAHSDDELALTDNASSTPASSRGVARGRGRGRGKGRASTGPAVVDSEADLTSDVRPKRPRASLVKLEISDEEEGTASTAPSKGKGRARASRAKIEPIDDSADEDDSEDGNFAMGSDAEDKQLKKAIRASKKDVSTFNSTASSSEASSQAGTSRNKKGQALGGRASRGSLREAALKAATGRTGRKIKESPDDSESSGAESDFAPSELSQLTDYEAESGDEASDAGSEESVPLRRRGKATAKAAKGRRLDGQDEDEMPPDFEISDLHSIEDIRAYRREQARKHNETMKPIRKREAKLRDELGRKLTQGEKNYIRLSLHHKELVDVWGDLAAKIEPIKPVPMEAHPSLKLTLLPFQKESLYWMKKQEEGVWAGGMLADEMGMGKTIQTIALLLSEPRRKPSLVVAPVVALMQWKHEIETHAEGFTVCLWHGTGRMKSSELKKFDVVLVSYGTLEASFRRQQRGFKRGDKFIKEQSPMHEFEWFRVILDEAHNIKERSTNAAKAAFALKAKYRWCLSGTPLQNRVGELYSLVRFLGADPFSYYFCKKCDCKSLHWQFSDRRHCDQCKHKPMDHVSLWNSEILTPIARYGIEEGGPGQTAFKKLKILLDRMMLRRTKLERADDLGLPPRTIVVRRDFFSPQEKELYMSLFTNAKRQFNTYLDQGTVLNNYSNIFSLITRMRQMACHPDLVLKSKTSSLAQAVTEGTVCRLCNDTAEDAIVSACKHVFDRECIRQYLEVQQLRGHRPECPVCHIEISIDLEQEAMEIDEASSKKARQGILSRLNLDNWRSSSKLEALVEELEKLRRQDCTIKSLVFSQFVSFLDLIAFRLQRAGFTICRLEGGMTPQQRDATIQHFMNNTNVTVFLISLKAGGVALNLTEASMVFMMDSWWNPSVEYQAMDRIHRLGQKRPVKVVKLIVEDSIEDQIVQLQHKKLAMTEAALSKDPDAALGKLTVEDLGFLFKL
ncbi:DNA repair protein rad16 [Cryptotrichosporon argae]